MQKVNEYLGEYSYARPGGGGKVSNNNKTTGKTVFRQENTIFFPVEKPVETVNKDVNNSPAGNERQKSCLS